MPRPKRNSGTLKNKRFNYHDWHLWYELKYTHRLIARDIAEKFECSEQHVQKTVKRMYDEGYGKPS